MKIGTAYSNEPSSLRSGKAVATMAMASGNLDQAHLVFAFCTSEVDPDAFFKGLRSVVGEQTPIVGGSAVGIITNSDIGYEGYAAGAMVIDSPELIFHIAYADAIDKGEYQAGLTMAERLPVDFQARLLMLFYDSVKNSASTSTPLIMNASPPLIEGVYRIIPSDIPIIGAGVLGDLDFQPPYQFCGNSIRQQAVVGVFLGGPVKVYSRIMHGCTPQNGIYHTITRSKGAIIYEVDGRPVVDLIDEIYGDRNWHLQKPVKRLTIGVNYGQKFSEYDENHFVNRLIAGVLPQCDGIVIFEPDLPEGTEIIFMLRDAQEMIRSARNNSILLMDQIMADSATPCGAIYIDCAGRAAKFSETLTEEASEIVQTLNRFDVPLLGFYSGVEIAPLLGKSRGLDWTGILLILAQ